MILRSQVMSVKRTREILNELDADIQVLEHAARVSVWIQRLSGVGFAFLGLLTVFSALTFFFGPTNDLSAISRQLDDHAEAIWNAAWGLGGILVMFGALRPHILLEMIGQFILGASFVVYLVAIISVAGFSPAVYLVVFVIVLVGLRIYFLINLAPRLVYLLADSEHELLPTPKAE